MALKTSVLVSSITNLSDARYCAGMGVEMLGFDLDVSSVNYLQPQTFKVITEWVAGIKTVGEIPQAEASDLEKLLASYSIDFLQVEYSGDWKSLRSVGIPLICKVEWKGQFEASSFVRQYDGIVSQVEYFLLQLQANVLSDNLLAQVGQVAEKYPVLLDLGTLSAHIESVLSRTQIKGIALKGSQEIRPGLKDFDDLASVLEALECEG